jgi:aspartate aminotransferase-like enzyme
MINCLDSISKICQKYDIKICVDIVSSLGTQKLNLSNIYLASACSSKGLASYSGLSIIFYNHIIGNKKQKLPTNINLGIFKKSNGIPFSLSSNLLLALDRSLRNFENFEKRINAIKNVSDKLRVKFEDKGINVLVNKDTSSPSTMTIILNKEQDSVELGQELKKNNILVSFESEYLVKHNWIQVCFMGANPDYNKTKVILEYL